MNRRKVNGSKVDDLSLVKRENDCASNSTDSFDMNDFKSSSLNQKYSVQIHKNKADLMAELSNINIMGDESDVEMLESQTQQNGLSACASVSDWNSSKVTTLNSSRSTDARSNGDFENDKQERILAWAQSQSQNLSMCVASILSDHDYLSQQSLVGLVTGNEENNELEMQSQRELNGTTRSNEQNGNLQQNGDLENTTNRQTSDIANKQRDNEGPSASYIADLNVIMNNLRECSNEEQRLLLLANIEEKTKSMKAQLTATHQPNKAAETAQNSIANQSESNNDTPEFSPNHSEPMEYNGNTRFTTDSSSDPSKEIDGKYLIWQ